MLAIEAKEVHIDDRFLHVDLEDGRRISTQITWYPTLLEAKLQELRDYQFICDGTGVEWESLDYHLSVENMLQTPSAQHLITRLEVEFSFPQWHPAFKNP